jgi:RNA polymerase sigma-70 factor (ECF subfamily)
MRRRSPRSSERHAPRAEKLAAHVLADPEDARDAAQEALAKLCVRLRQFRGDSQFATWLHRLVVNTCLDVADRQRVAAASRCSRTSASRDDADPARERLFRSCATSWPRSSATLSHEQASVVV